MPENLNEMLALLPSFSSSGDTDRLITAIVDDSRKVVPGSLFVCLKGATVDGHEYAATAASQGAVAILTEQDLKISAQAAIIRVPDTRKALAQLAPRFFGEPGKKLRLIGVTGTNGKTTTTHIIREIFASAGMKSGLMGTLHTLIGDRKLPVKNTTPDIIQLQSTLKEMVDAGLQYTVMEVSSHALAIDRIAGCEFDIAVFTNMTQDHLDFHGTLENYRNAKGRLFTDLGTKDAVKTGKCAVINLDDPAGVYMQSLTSARSITYGVTSKADVVAKDVSVKPTGADFTVEGLGLSIPVKLKVTGLFNVYNMLAAIAVALAENIDPAIITNAVENFRGVDGRFERVDVPRDFAVIVDYAHTPDGLENVLRTSRQLAKRRLIAVFGCGGDRDRTKRPIMGALSMQYADCVIITSDNPRSEDPEAIVREIEAGARPLAGPNHSLEIIVDRRQAIERALNIAGEQDIVLIAGKGHETYQILKDRTIHFDDREVVRELTGVSESKEGF